MLLYMASLLFVQTSGHFQEVLVNKEDMCSLFQSLNKEVIDIAQLILDQLSYVHV